MDPRYQEALGLFDQEKFFECHELLEELWHEEHGVDRDFYQGLIQVATALHHFGLGNLKGARLLYESSLSLLAPYPEIHRGMALKKLLKEVEGYLGPEVLLPPLETLPGRAQAKPPGNCIASPPRITRVL